MGTVAVQRSVRQCALGARPCWKLASRSRAATGYRRERSCAVGGCLASGEAPRQQLKARTLGGAPSAHAWACDRLQVMRVEVSAVLCAIGCGGDDLACCWPWLPHARTAPPQSAPHIPRVPHTRAHPKDPSTCD